jgi:Endosomal/lysosomal potassium channel TMEM175
MSKGRLEAFSDGVIAILTIMVLELKVPHGATWAALSPLLPVFLSYVLSFVYLGIYWNNHHHLLHGDRKGPISTVGYASAIPLAFVHQSISHAIYVDRALVADPGPADRREAERVTVALSRDANADSAASPSGSLEAVEHLPLMDRRGFGDA